MPTKECRICLRREEKCVSLFARRRGTKLAEIIRFCAKVEISEDDGLPGDACPRCVDEALNAYLFVNKCRRSDADLRTAQAFAKDNLDEEESVLELNNVDQSEDAASEAGTQKEDSLNEAADETDPKQFSPTNVAVLEKFEQNVVLPIVESKVEERTNAERQSVEVDQNVQHCYEEQLESIEYAVEIKREVETKTEDGNIKSPVRFVVEDDDENFLVEYLDDDSTSDEGSETIVNDQTIACDDTELEYLETISRKSTQNFLCCGIRCESQFSSHQELTEHSIVVHMHNRQHECAEKPFECNQCFARFNTEKSLNLHSRKPAYCPLCLDSFNSLKEKRLHMLQAHGSSTVVPLKNSSKKICCGCHESFDNPQELQAHSEQRHSIRKSAIDETKPLQCGVCYKLFRTTESLRIHQRFVYRPKNFICSMCHRGFDTRSKLITHELVHTNERNFPCNKCNKSFKKEIDLRGHMLLHNEKQEVCTVCGLRFHRKSNLKMHMRKHQDTFFYACPDCPKQFKNNSHLKEHYKVHSKQQPYTCNYCERSFSYYSDRKRHEMSHTGNYPFQCECCTKKFARKTTFEKHQAICQDYLKEALD